MCVCNEYYVVKKVQLKKNIYLISPIKTNLETTTEPMYHTHHITLFHFTLSTHSDTHRVLFGTKIYYIILIYIYTNNYTRVHIKPPFTSHHLSLKLEKYVLLLLKQIYLNQPSYQFHQIIKRNISTFPLSKNFPFYHEIVQEVIIHF